MELTYNEKTIIEALSHPELSVQGVETDPAEKYESAISQIGMLLKIEGYMEAVRQMLKPEIQQKLIQAFDCVSSTERKPEVIHMLLTKINNKLPQVTAKILSHNNIQFQIIAPKTTIYTLITTSNIFTGTCRDITDCTVHRYMQLSNQNVTPQEIDFDNICITDTIQQINGILNNYKDTKNKALYALLFKINVDYMEAEKPAHTRIVVPTPHNLNRIITVQSQDVDTIVKQVKALVAKFNPDEFIETHDDDTFPQLTRTDIAEDAKYLVRKFKQLCQTLDNFQKEGSNQ